MRPSRALLAAVVGAQLAWPRATAGLSRAGRERATRGMVGLMWATSVTETVEARGVRRAAALHGVAFGVPFAAEVAGVATGRIFGTYHYGDGLGRKVAGVPVMVGAPWSLMARPAWAVAGLVAPGRAARAMAAAGALTAWDVFLDPRMAAEGFWTWPRGGRYEGVPASNFAGWLATGAAVFALWALLDGDDDPRDGGADGALALYGWTWVGETVANAAFFGRPRVAAAGALAMGLFAAPALRARLRGAGA